MPAGSPTGCTTVSRRAPRVWARRRRGLTHLTVPNGIDEQHDHPQHGARLGGTSEDEWYKAAYYKGGSTNAGYWDYPTRSDSAPGRTWPTPPGTTPTTRRAAMPIDSPYYRTVVGEFQKSASPYGTFDQGGNVWEWNETIVRYVSRAAGRVVQHQQYPHPVGRQPRRRHHDGRVRRSGVSCCAGRRSSASGGLDGRSRLVVRRGGEVDASGGGRSWALFPLLRAGHAGTILHSTPIRDFPLRLVLTFARQASDK